MTTEISAIPWVIVGVVILALIIGYFACSRPVPEVKGRRWAWNGKEGV